MTLRNASAIALGVSCGALVCLIGLLGAPVKAQSQHADDYQRSTQIYGYHATAKSGPKRGEELYYYKCWICHNQYAKTGPQLHDLFKRDTFTTSADPVNDQTVAARIREGGAGMPAFGTTLKPADIADLLSYLKDGCCFDSHNPPPNPAYRESKVSVTPAPAKRMLQGGARGVVHSPTGDAIEGVGVQLISAKTNIRTTVYSNVDGKYEFPVLEAGDYTLRIPSPREYKPFVKESVKIDGADKLDDIVLERISQTEFVPATPETLSQLTGSEWLLNLNGTAEEKRVFSFTCGFGCHSYQQIFRNRYDEPSWRVMVQRMTRGSGSPLINMAKPTPESLDRADQPVLQDEVLLTKWLARIRAPESQDEPVYFLPRPKGASTKVVVTEYELPRALLAPHDVFGDAKGNIYYTAHRSPFQGALDPRTGNVKEYRIPNEDQDVPGVLPGTHHVMVDKNGIVWYSGNWDHYLTGLDPKTGKVIYRVLPPGADVPLNSPGFGNYGMDDAGNMWALRNGAGVAKFDPATGKLIKMYQTKNVRTTYDNLISPDGRYWSGSPIGTRWIGLIDTKTDQLWEMQTDDVSSGSRGAFDPQGNAWYGGRGGMLIKLDPKTRHISEYYSPIQYDTFYECMPDKNGEIWAGGLQSGRVMRFNPRTEKWTQYMMPEPYAHDRRTWIDNSTNPVTMWYVDHEGFMVRVQPFE